MKTITLLPVKNESWILRSTLKNISDFSDHIIIADQNSTDGSKDIYKEFGKVSVIENMNQGHSNSIRWELLDYVRKIYGTCNLIICIDADEMISPEAIKQIKVLADKEKQTVSFSFPWIQLWDGIDKYRNDSVWKNNYKTIAFIDDGKIDYDRINVINDHTGRIPKCAVNVILEEFPLLHYQYILPKQAEIKQAWYRCSELIGGGKPRMINHKYSITSTEKMILKNTKYEWFELIPAFSVKYKTDTDWRYQEILKMFSRYGVEKFEAIAIWQIKEFKEIFIREKGREPRPKTFPGWLTRLNDVKNKIIN